MFKLIFEESTGESVVLCNLEFCGIILAVGALKLAILSAVVYKSFGWRSKMTNRFYDMNNGQEVDIPFSEMYLLSSTHSIKRKNGRIIVSVKCLEYMHRSPFVGQSSFQALKN